VAEVEPRRLRDELVGVAQKLGFEVRVEPFRAATRSAGGLCRLRDRVLILLDANSNAVDQARALAEALATLDLEDVYMAPEARGLIDRLRSGRAAPAKPAKSGKS
jgi:hypothetical protein